MSDNSTSNNNDAPMTGDSEKRPLKEFPKLHDYPYSVGTPITPAPPVATEPPSVMPSDSTYDNMQDAPQRPPAAMPVGVGIGVVNIALAFFLAPAGFIVSIVTLIVNRKRKGIGKILTWVALSLSILIMVISSILVVSLFRIVGDVIPSERENIPIAEAIVETNQVLEQSKEYYLKQDFMVEVFDYEGYDIDKKKTQIWLYKADNPNVILIIDKDQDSNIVSSEIVPIESVELFESTPLQGKYSSAEKSYFNTGYTYEDGTEKIISIDFKDNQNATSVGDIKDYRFKYNADGNNNPISVASTSVYVKTGDGITDYDVIYKYYETSYIDQKYYEEYQKATSEHVELQPVS